MFDWNAQLRPIIALSPMADMTDSAFCRTVRKICPTSSIGPIVFREMVSAEAVVRGNDKTLNMTNIHEQERPLIQQIFGADPKAMAEAAKKIEASHRPNGFDVNMGCPVYKIVSNFNGCALMKEPSVAASIVKEMKSAITVPLSVKIRLGWSDPTECLEFVKVLEDAGADLITIHGRTKAQGYSGQADWEMIARAKQNVSIPVLANGDVHKAEIAPKALRISQADGLLIARGALGNPWIFKQIQEALARQPISVISIKERLATIRTHLALHLEQYGEHGIITFRKHLTWYFKGLPQAKRLREQITAIKTEPELQSLLDQLC